MIESVQQGVCLPEDDFEIHGDTVNGPNHNGPFRARNAKRLLLDRFEIYCHGQFTGMPISDTKLLILMLGAKLVNHPKEFTDNPRCFIIAEPDRTLKEQSYYDRLKQKFSAEVVSREWLLDNVAQYKIQNPRLYSLCENALTNNME
ncbi:breast cancer type 1 susceptibility protein homolog [Lineus longissimus]|uniref:breast cancer type 1 susceptibility protein homolog n=1 Tax=Lineus longissimus TaxID=88925 RepID=UPI00315D2C18